MDRKKKIDMHTNIATALLDQIKVMRNERSDVVFVHLSLRLHRIASWTLSSKWKTK